MTVCLNMNRTHPQDGRWSWYVCACVFLSAALVQGFTYSFGVLLPHLMEQFNSDRQSTVWVGSISTALMTSIGVITTTLCDRFGCRCMTMCGSLFCLVSLIASSFANSLALQYFTYGVLFGIGNSFVFTASMLITPKYFTKWRSLAISIHASGMGAGILVMGPTIQALVEPLGWRGALRVIAGSMALVAILGIILDENNTVCAAEASEQAGVNCQKAVHRKKKKLIDCSVWGIPVYSVITSSAALAFLAHFSPQIHLIKYTEELHIPQHKAARLYIFMGVTTFLSRPLIGALCSISGIKAQYLYQLALFGSGAATLLLPLATGYSGLVAYAVVYGTCDGVLISMFNVLILSSLDQERRACGLGMQMFITSITTLIGPPLAGLIADHYDSYVPAFYVGGAISVAAGAVVFLLLCCNQTTVPAHNKHDTESSLEKINYNKPLLMLETHV